MYRNERFLSVSEITDRVATRPKVHRCELGLAIVRIARRRAKVDDRDREKLPDTPESDPREVVDYLRQYSGATFRGGFCRRMCVDALTLNNWLWWEGPSSRASLLEGRP